MALVTTSYDPIFDTGDDWAIDSSIKPKIYAVSAIKADGSESFLSSQVQNDDRDHYALTDAKEITAGTDPTNPDCDGDGIKARRRSSLGHKPFKH